MKTNKICLPGALRLPGMQTNKQTIVPHVPGPAERILKAQNKASLPEPPRTSVSQGAAHVLRGAPARYLLSLPYDYLQGPLVCLTCPTPLKKKKGVF